jgi:thiamine-phosphate pyrophosphorylase
MPAFSTPKRSVLCYITERSAFAGDESARSKLLLEKIVEAARAHVDFVQLREKDLTGRALEKLARSAVETIRNVGRKSQTKLLVNGRVDMALAAGADGVHLPVNDLSASEVRSIWAHAGKSARPIISKACHTVEEVRVAAESGADFVLFAPVFEKNDAPGVRATGLEALHEACLVGVPVLALGGVTLANAGECFEAGAAGIAAIRLFQESDVTRTVSQLRGLVRAGRR